MDTNHADHHISHQFDHELADIRTKVLTMGSLVEQQIHWAINAFLTGDIELAEQVIKHDVQVNQMESDIDQECIGVIALRQPAAFDLRMLIAVIKILTEIERQGDLAKDIARMAIHLASDSGRVDAYHELHHLSDMVNVMLHQVFDSFARQDIAILAKMAGQDENLKLEYKSIVRLLISRMLEQPRNMTRTLDIMWVAKALEKIGDHACNIGEHIIYMVTGNDVRHIGETNTGFCHSCAHLLELDKEYYLCQLKDAVLTPSEVEKSCPDYEKKL